MANLYILICKTEAEFGQIQICVDELSNLGRKDDDKLFDIHLVIGRGDIRAIGPKISGYGRFGFFFLF